MSKRSAGLLVYREASSGSLEVFLVHPGGPFWKNKDEGAWSIPKGEFTDEEDPLTSAKREFREETGFDIDGAFEPLQPVKQAGGKTVYAWAVKGDLDAAAVRSNRFALEWPPGSGKVREFPEVDRGAWFGLDVARHKVVKGQVDLLDQLALRLSGQR